jgi:hypothetical protein
LRLLSAHPKLVRRTTDIAPGIKATPSSDLEAGNDAKETTMSATEMTLHWAVDKWLAPTPAMPARVVRLCHTQLHRRYVCVEAMHPGGLLSIIFFRHDDGSWNVYPPALARPTMFAWRNA